MMMRAILILLPALLAGCAAQEPPPAQKAQTKKVSPVRSLDMEQLCKDRAAQRYNTGAQKIDVTGFEQFQGSYEMQGFTARNESFICSFDADGHFLHLSMR
ncbi:YsaB family lipoprotein [Leclercia adecarboxylata]|uniref:YsaB family lipoprotein n=1 Tax=Leclercia adecarboxylata TaxID=83655 RepID=UPI002DB6EF57|nr:YsaB family lipoprotein [Leclercia adecarboxylata]MEB6380978.1 YsaB family lipoprotein [Leclercia adecarboxylata]